MNAAREIYLNKLAAVNDVVRFTADRVLLLNSVAVGRHAAGEALVRTREREKLDVLGVTDRNGRVVLRATSGSVVGDDQSQDELVRAVMERAELVAAACLVSAENLRRESPALAEQAHFQFIETPKARRARRRRNRPAWR